MFKRHTRLSRADISTLIKTGGSQTSPHFSVRFKTTPEASKAAVVVSKKVAAKAVERNTLKRRMRAPLLKALNGTPGLNIVLFARKGATELDARQLEEEVVALVSKVHKS